MNAIVQFIVKHGYSVLFAAVFARQIGLPIPGPLFLLAAGALAANGKLSLVGALGLAVAACVLADWPWYEAGRRRGDQVLHFLHRLARNPDARDRRAKKIFARYGPPLLVLAKFVPGLDAVAPPLAGTSRTSRLRFLTFDALGASLYSVVYTGLGYVFSHDLDRVAAYMARAGRLLSGIVLAGVVIYGVQKLVLRYRSVRKFRIVRVKLITLLEEIRGNRHGTTTGDIRKLFGDYHNVLRWLAVFLIGDDKVAATCVVDACSVAQTQTPVFHEWLAHWAAQATVRCALQLQHARIVELAPEHEKHEPVHRHHPPLSAGYFRLLIEKSEDMRSRLDVLCRFALVMRGIGRYSCIEVAAQLGITPGAVERAYCHALDTLKLAASEAACNADVPRCPVNRQRTLAGSAA
ncbi:MAG TPA: DedA family protein [Terriglobales bacterium]|nr:DedA family protein [Terriglobales bacterium]